LNSIPRAKIAVCFFERTVCDAGRGLFSLLEKASRLVLKALFLLDLIGQKI